MQFLGSIEGKTIMDRIKNKIFKEQIGIKNF
jgi:hypothetical protein